MTSKTTCALVLLTLMLSACTVNHTPDEAQTAAVSTYFEEDAKRVNELLIFGPQPEEIDLNALKENGLQKVISFRTPKEIEELDYEQKTALQALGIEFVNIPVGGDEFPYSPAVYQSLVDELSSVDAKDGAVLLHCKSGWRASVVGVAYLVRHEGMELNEALKYAEGWWPLSLEKVLDTKLSVQEL